MTKLGKISSETKGLFTFQFESFFPYQRLI